MSLQESSPILEAVKKLEGELHPESMVMQFPHGFDKIFLLKSSRFRNALRWSLWMLSAAAVVLTTPAVGLSSPYQVALTTSIIIMVLFTMVGLYVDMPRAAALLNWLINRAGALVFLLILALVLLALVLVVFAPDASYRMNGIGFIILAFSMTHLVNQFAWGTTWKQRARTRSVARVSHLLQSAGFAAGLLALLFYIGYSIQRSTDVEVGTSTWARIAYLVTAVGVVAGLSNRILSQQRRSAGRLLKTLNETALRLVHDGSAVELHRSAMELDARLAAGIDSRSSVFKTPWETEWLRMILRVLFRRLGCPLIDEEGQMYRRAITEVGCWDAVRARFELLCFIQVQKKFLVDGVGQDD